MNKELTPYYNLTQREWGGLDATGKEALAIACRETLERWQAYQKSRKELQVSERSNHPRRFESQASILMDEWKASVYDRRLSAIVECLNIHEEELFGACMVSPVQLLEIMAKKYQMSKDEAAAVLRQTLPIFKAAPKSK